MSFLAKFSQTSTKADVNALSNPINKCEGTLMRIFFFLFKKGRKLGEKIIKEGVNQRKKKKKSDLFNK
jgi:hypothetical protein